MKNTQLIKLMDSMFIDSWKKDNKENESVQNFALTAQECADRLKKHCFRGAISGLFFALAAFGLFFTGLICFFFRSEMFTEAFVASTAFITITVSFGITGFLIKPEKLGKLTERVGYDWKEFLKSIRKHHGLKNSLETVSSVEWQKSDLAYTFSDLIKNVSVAAEAAGNREELKEKKRLKSKLSSLCHLAKDLGLFVPDYKRIFAGDTQVRTVPPANLRVTLRACPGS